MASSALVLGSAGPIEPILSDLDIRLSTDDTGEPDILLVPYSAAPAEHLPLAELRQRWPETSIVLLVPAGEVAELNDVAHLLDADLLPMPPERRRAESVLRFAVERRSRRVRRRALVERVRGHDRDLAEQVAAELGEHERAIRSAEEAGRIRSAVLANVSHEIRTPVTVLRGLLDVLEEDLRDRISSDERDILARVRASAEHLLALIQDLLDLSRAEAGLLDARREVVHLPDLIREVSGEVERNLGDRPVRLVTNVPRAIEWVTIDRVRLRQILLHLLSNASKFTAEGEIGLTVNLTGASHSPDPQPSLRAPAPSGDVLEIVVTDTGSGIPPARQQEMFEAFQQADLSMTRSHEGLGIGLTVVREAARALGAEVRLRSEEGRGTEVRVGIPLRESSVREAPPSKLRPTTGTALRPTMPTDVLAELAALSRAHPRTLAEVPPLTLDAVLRLLRPEAALWAAAPSGADAAWRTTDTAGNGIAPGSPLPFDPSGLEESRPSFLHSPDGERWGALRLRGGRGILAARWTAEQDRDDDRDLRLLQISGRWLFLWTEIFVHEGDRSAVSGVLGRNVKEPLGRSLGFCQELLRNLRGDLSPEQRETVLRIEQIAHRTLHTVLDLIDHERVRTEGFRPDRSSYSAKAVIEHVLSRLGATLELGRFRIHRHIEDPLPLCIGDEIRTDRSLSRILHIFTSGMSPGAELAVSLTRADGFVRCEIVGPTAQRGLFEEALRQNPAALTPGTTLPVALGRGWIEAQGGRIAMADDEGHLVVRVDLPAERRT